MTLIARCGGHEVPESYKTEPSQDFNQKIEWTKIESNKKLSQYRIEKNVPKVTFGVWDNPKFDTKHNYEVWTPVDFDPSGDKKYAVFLEVYAGIEFQKVEHRYKGKVYLHKILAA